MAVASWFSCRSGDGEFDYNYEHDYDHDYELRARTINHQQSTINR